MLDGLALLFATLFFWGPIAVIVCICVFALVFSVWVPVFTVTIVISLIVAVLGYAMLSVLK